MNILNHIGIIMDGNGRWAESRGLMRFMGHDEGIKTFEKTLEWCIEEIPFLSVYAFSTENWTRESVEVDHIFMLMNKYLKMKQQELIDRGICVNIIGDTTKLDQECIDIVEDIAKNTKSNRNMTVQLAVNYGGRDEIVRATKKLFLEIQDKDMSINDITEEIFERHLDTCGIPDVDLLIRTGALLNILWTVKENMVMSTSSMSFEMSITQDYREKSNFSLIREVCIFMWIMEI